MLKKIEIKQLFDQFDYEIELKDEGITILTGPNGYGKTTVLRIIHAFSRKNISYLMNLLFQKITFYMENGDEFHLANEKGDITFKSPTQSFETININEFEEKLISQLHNIPFQQIGKNEWVDLRTDEVFNTKEAILRSREVYGSDVKLTWEYSEDFPEVYLIREQRLIKSSVSQHRYSKHRSRHDENESNGNFSDTIKLYAHELTKLIKNVRAESSKITQELDSSFPARLFKESESISDVNFDARFKGIKKTQEKLSKYGLSVSSTEDHAYKQENSKALKVYLDDTEKKLIVFNDLLQKLDTFTTILDEHHFSFKKLKVNPDSGFEFFTENDHKLELTDLSSGEQQQVVLLYELVFQVAPGTLVLVDEPEISLHVAWQKEFLKDLLRIIKIQDINVILATHSPQIINDRWDLTVDLEEIGK